MQDTHGLQKELIKYSAVRAELQAQYPDVGFVVIKGDEVLGVWESRMDALKAGIDKYGNVPFLVKDLYESDVAINFTRHLVFA